MSTHRVFKQGILGDITGHFLKTWNNPPFRSTEGKYRIAKRFLKINLYL